MPRPADAIPARYSIAAVSKLTGIGCHALRVWERRYGFPVPLRSSSGHRRYAADQVEALGRVARRHRMGEPLSELMAEVRSSVAPTAESGEISSFPEELYCSPLLDRLEVGDLDGADSAFLRLIDGLSPAECLKRVIHPGLVEVGERWFRAECDIFQEHAATAFLVRKLMILTEAARAANPSPRRLAVVGTVQGDRHEGGVLMLGLLLELAGWRSHVLGVDLPAREYQKAMDLWRPDAVCLSFVLSRNVTKRFDELAKLQGAPIYVGGRSLVNYQGLARRHGLHPLVGPGEEMVQKLIVEVEATNPCEHGSGAN